MIPPKLIYKYEGTDQFSLLNLKNGGIYFAAPSDFNDPYDCNLGFHLGFDTSKLQKYRKGEFPFHDDRSTELQTELNTRTDDELKQLISPIATKVIETNIQKMRNDFGVSCFSEINNNLLLWSHYSNSGQGFCLEFDTSYEPFTKIFKVNYKTELPTLDAIDIFNNTKLNDTQLNDASKLWLTKSIDWEYEKEWRIIHKSKGTLFIYPQEALKSIYFGPLVKRAFLEIICLILQGQNKHIRFYLGHISKREFKVEFTEFKYTPFVSK